MTLSNEIRKDLTDICALIEAGNRPRDDETHRETALRLGRLIREVYTNIENIVVEATADALDARQAPAEPDCEPDCLLCSGEACETHGTDPCECATDERHQRQAPQEVTDPWRS